MTVSTGKEVISLGFCPVRVENRAVGLIHFSGSEDGKTLIIYPSNEPLQDLPATPRGLDDEVGYFTEETHHGITFQNPPLSPEEIAQAKRLNAATYVAQEDLTAEINDHPKHYWCLIQYLKRRKKNAYALCNLLGEGSTVACAIWKKYDTPMPPVEPAAEQTSGDGTEAQPPKWYTVIEVEELIMREFNHSQRNARELAEWIAPQFQKAYEKGFGHGRHDPHRELLADAQLRDMEVMGCGHPQKYGAAWCLACELEATKKELAELEKLLNTPEIAEPTP